MRVTSRTLVWLLTLSAALAGAVADEKKPPRVSLVQPARFRVVEVAKTTVTESKTKVATPRVLHEEVLPLKQEAAKKSDAVESCDSCGACAACQKWYLGKRVHDRWHAYCLPALKESHWGYAPYFCERPFGTLARTYCEAQVLKGKANRCVLYHYDFVEDFVGPRPQLRTRGEEELRRMAQFVAATGSPLFIQSTAGNPNLDEQRRTHVMGQLKTLGFDIPAELVVVARPPNVGFRGDEAIGIDSGRISTSGLGQGQGGGGQGAGGAGGAGGVGGAGAGLGGGGGAGVGAGGQ